MMAEKWKTNDSARMMTRKFNKVVEELGNHDDKLSEQIESESTGVIIHSPTSAVINKLLGRDTDGSE